MRSEQREFCVCIALQEHSQIASPTDFRGDARPKGCEVFHAAESHIAAQTPAVLLSCPRNR